MQKYFVAAVEAVAGQRDLVGVAAEGAAEQMDPVSAGPDSQCIVAPALNHRTHPIHRYSAVALAQELARVLRILPIDPQQAPTALQKASEP